jgi:hypothetical protein
VWLSLVAAPGVRELSDYERYHRGSGRFYGTFLVERIVQEAHDARYDRRIGEVKDVPIEARASDLDVKKHEICNRAICQPIDAVSDCAADDEAK